MAVTDEQIDSRPVDRPTVVDKWAGTAKGGFEEYAQMLRFSGRAIKALPGSLWYFSEVLRQFASIALETIGLLVFMEFMIGISSSNFSYFLLKALGATDFTGIGGALTIRVALVTMFGYVFVAKVCGGFVAEIGAMKIGQEISALESIGVDPMKYVVGTRIWAALMLIPVAAAVSMIGFYAGFYTTSVIILHGVSSVGMHLFFWGTQSLRDFEYVTVVIAVTTVTTVLAACFYGMRSEGGPAAIGEGVARSVIVNIVLLHIVGSVIVTLWYLNNYGLPIGG